MKRKFICISLEEIVGLESEMRYALNTYFARRQGTQIRRMRAARVKEVIEMDGADRNFPEKA